MAPQPEIASDRNLALDLVRVSEAAALAAARWMGRGQKNEADGAAVEAMRRVFDSMAIDGTVVIGEGEMDEAPMLYIGERVGAGGPAMDIAVDPLEGTSITAKGGPNAIAVVALAEQGNFLHAPDIYMDKLAVGPGLPEGVNRGYFVRPTVFADVSPDMTIFRQEIFGPVLSITPFDTEEEAVELANDTIYGLTNYVQTQDGARRNRLARQLKAGMIEMNGVSRGRGSAFGGVKASGRAREGGVWGLEEFMDSKQISGWDKDA